ncbi:MAG TPA: PAS domain-containing protein [Polyangiaceae bacterium]
MTSGNDLRDRVAALEANLAERMGVVQHLQESEERLRTLLENSPDSITVLDEDGKLLYLNRTVPTRRVEDIIGTSSVSYMSESDGKRFLEALRTAIRTGEPQTVEVQTATTSPQWWQTRLVPLRETGGIRTVMGIGTDVTERRRTLEALRRSEETLRLAVEAAGMGLWSWDLGRDSFDLDAVSASMLGFPAAVSGIKLGAIIARVYKEDQARSADAAQAFATTGELVDFEVRVTRPDGRLRSLLVSGRARGDAPLVVIGSAFDVTERRRLEEQLRQAQKMEAVGQLTAGIAHNFNNLLAAIIPSIQLSRRDAQGLAGERLKDAEYAATRAAELVKQLMVFARHRRVVERESVDLAVVVRRTVGICRATFDQSIDIQVVEQGGRPMVMGEAGQLEQLLLNICLNARDAFGAARSPGRRMLLELSVISVELPPDPPQDQVSVRISDNGPGMTETVRARVFEPFFTTKEVGKGTGLGLATAYAIASDHGGRLSCESVVGEGTTFTLLLPATSEPAVERVRTIDALVRGGNETILVIDDERLVRKTVRSVLEPAGYRVLDAADGIAGFELFQREGRGIDLVLLDLSMPGIPGDTVLANMLRERPDARVVLFTGHRPDVVPEGARAILQKPFPMDALLRVVRDICDGPTAAYRLA